LPKSEKPAKAASAPRAEALPFSVEFSARDPQGRLSQDKEWCVVKFKRRIRFHDYHELYKIPGLYEHIFYHCLQCTSPTVVCGHLQQEVEKAGQTMDQLSVLDIGAGNGMVGERLQQLGTQAITGIDIIEEARQSTFRDRPNVYKEYFIMDLTDMPGPVRLNLEASRFNTLVTIAALGFGDIPVRAFANAYNMVTDAGWIAFNIKEDFVSQKDYTGFSGLIRRMLDTGVLELRHQERYRHRLATDGTPLHYISMVGVKKGNVPESFLEG
jgi:SAM-dependent methyltransferase